MDIFFSSKPVESLLQKTKKKRTCKYLNLVILKTLSLFGGFRGQLYSYCILSQLVATFDDNPHWVKLMDNIYVLSYSKF